MMKGKKTFGQKIHSLLFATAGKVHTDSLQSELADSIRDDIIKMKIADKPSISALTVARKIKLINLYREILGDSKRVMIPAKYDPQKRANTNNPDAIPTPDQIEELCRRLDKLGFPSTGDSREMFIKRQCGYKLPPTRAKYQQVMGALRSMEDRGWKVNQLNQNSK
jgi:hypothetical protein